ncbi:hypothetical protein B0T17DRAFT_601412 [Bombardia bombarda]|uniref:Uncharacterized protein n=1 Tax=Bombardia bombarda TaxID=252184 RepID=A0AA39WN67_9PEZI|nr:hypothetical protein B0T17DRAFT_601412 [Bombardia bombarda]
MTTTDSFGHILPLRETCNRCRELKVRCRANCSTTTIIGGLALKFGVKPVQEHIQTAPSWRACDVHASELSARTDRSGRPRTTFRAPAAVYGNNTRCKTFARPPQSQAFPPSFDWESAPSPTDLLSENLSSSLDSGEFATFRDGRRPSGPGPVVETMAISPGQDQTSPSVWDMGLAYTITTSPPSTQEQQLHAESDDDMVKDVKELMSLNVRIHQLQAQIGNTPPMLALCDDIASITQSFLGYLEHMVESSKNLSYNSRHPSARVDMALPTPPCSLEMLQIPTHHQADEGLDADLRRQLIEGKIYANDNFLSVCNNIDASTFFLILSCHQRLVDLFKHVCLLIHTRLQEQEDDSELQLSTAQVVMSTELISHLLGRLDRGLQRLTPTSPPTLSPTTTTTSSSSCLSTVALHSLSAFDTSDTSDLAAWPATDPGGEQQTMRPSTPNCMLGASMAINALARRQAALRGHIGIIKQSIQESNNF